jgi:hypothetical protein
LADKNVVLEKYPEVRFVHPAAMAPWANGAVESLVRITRSRIEKMTKGQAMTKDQYKLLFAESQNLLNNRPLTAKVTGDRFDTITPSDLVYGRSTKNLLGPSDCKSTKGNKFGIQNNDFVKQLRHRRMLLNIFWRLFYSEYVSELAVKPAWRQGGVMPPCQVGDVVLAVPPPKRKSKATKRKSKKKARELAGVKTYQFGGYVLPSRGHWQLAVVTHVFPDEEGIVRNATVRLQDGTVMTRNVRSLALLEGVNANMGGSDPPTDL